MHAKNTMPAMPKARLSFLDNEGRWHQCDWPVSWGYPVRKVRRPNLANLLTWIEWHGGDERIKEARLFWCGRVVAHVEA